MSQCRVCGNKLTESLAIFMDGNNYEFDCIACAKQALLPTCIHCGKKLENIIRSDPRAYYCCEQCAEGCELITAA